MPRSFNTELPFGGRAEYAELPLPDLLTECDDVTDVIDQILDAPQDSDGTYADSYTIGSNGLTQYRSFSYLHGNRASSQSWPIIEKTLEIQYSRTQSGANESYYVAVGTRIHQQYVSQDPLYAIYQINYSRKRSTVKASIQAPDIIASEDTTGDEDLTYEIRPSTTYDHVGLLEELGYLQTRLYAESQEADHLKS